MKVTLYAVLHAIPELGVQKGDMVVVDRERQGRTSVVRALSDREGSRLQSAYQHCLQPTPPPNIERRETTKERVSDREPGLVGWSGPPPPTPQGGWN